MKLVNLAFQIQAATSTTLIEEERKREDKRSKLDKDITSISIEVDELHTPSDILYRTYVFSAGTFEIPQINSDPKDLTSLWTILQSEINAIREILHSEGFASTLSAGKNYRP
jgi:hypothetical protein